MISVVWAYLAFAALGLASFRVLKPALASLSVFLGGWLLLPVGVFPPGSTDVVFPYWITGLAVPSQMLLTKAWVVPCVALAGTLIFDLQTARELRLNPFDLPVALWCLWPLMQALVSPDANPQPVLASLYLIGCWGTPWLLGRLYFGAAGAQRLLMQGLTWSAVALLPIALVEGVFGPGLAYAALYETHPFHLDGAERYLGFRPLGFFENGNQYGLWVGMCAIAAVWLARTAPPAERRRSNGLAAVVVVMALAAQSVGAIMLVVLGLALLFAVEFVSLRRLTLAALAAFVLTGTVYLSGAVPVRELATQTSIGRTIVDSFKGVGRGSFTWRISQDQKLLPLALQRPLVGSAQWDWWRSENVRPWGLPLLVTGQFGLIGAVLAFGLLLAPAVRIGLQGPLGDAPRGGSASMVLATLIMLTVVDALLNSFVFFPALLAAGGLARLSRSARSLAQRATFTPYRGPGRPAPKPAPAAAPKPPVAARPSPAAAGSPPAPTRTPRKFEDDRPVRSPGDPRQG